jgi:hypothetical protein
MESTLELSWVQMIVFLVAFMLVNYYGLIYTYQANQNGDGKSYFFRFSALSLPVGMRVALMFVIPMFLVVLFSDNYDSAINPAFVAESLLKLAAAGAFYFIMANSLRKVSQNAT